MRPIVLIILFLSPVRLALAQDSDSLLKREMFLLKTEIKKLRSVNAIHTNKINYLDNALKANTDNLQMQVSANSAEIKSGSSNLNDKIEQAGNNTTRQFYELNGSIKKRNIYWIVSFSILFILPGILYYLLRKRISNECGRTEKQISNTRKVLQEEVIRLDTKLAEILETQLKLLSTANQAEEIDHSLALRVSDEIVRIQKNFTVIDPNIKGIKHLADSVQRIKDNFQANGYEIPDLLYKPYDQRMKIIVREKIPAENLLPGEEVITRIIKPQVNYKGIMIQSAQVDVSVG